MPKVPKPVSGPPAASWRRLPANELVVGMETLSYGTVLEIDPPGVLQGARFSSGAVIAVSDGFLLAVR
jgi:hypothetical protein